MGPVNRCVLRQVNPAEGGPEFYCAACETPIRWKAREKRWKVIAHVYRAKRWVRDDHFHLQCYTDAGSPYGEAAA